jgi:hypothetical protein
MLTVNVMKVTTSNGHRAERLGKVTWRRISMFPPTSEDE